MPHAGEDEREHEIPGVCTAKWHLVSEEQGVSALSELADYLDVRQSERPKRFGGQGACCGWEGGGHWRGVGKGGQLGGTGLPAMAGWQKLAPACRTAHADEGAQRRFAERVCV